MNPLIGSARRTSRICRIGAAALLVHAAWACSPASPAELVTVRHAEGVVHGFLVLRTLDGKAIADGDLIQVAHDEDVTSQLVFHFRDGSLYDETTVFSQRGHFRLISDKQIERGPSFERPLTLSVDASSGETEVRYTDDKGREKVIKKRLDVPPDVANGLVPILLKNLEPGTPQTTVSMVAATPQPRLVKLVITPEGEDSFSIGATDRKATRYDIKVVIGGATGVLAKLFHKVPPDTHTWILRGEAPAFVKSEGPMSAGGPVWRTELTSPVWPVSAAASERKR